MRKVDILIAKLKAKQNIRKVKEARIAREMEKKQNVPTTRPEERPAEGQGIQPAPTSQPIGLGGDDGAGFQP
jgi:hypothetical protein